MERLKDLIDKLQQQQQQGERAEAMLVTVQQLQTELLALAFKKTDAANTKVAVVLPPRPVVKPAAATAKQPDVQAAASIKEAPLPQSPYAPRPEPVAESSAPETISEPSATQPALPATPEPRRERYNLQKPSITEIATPVQHNAQEPFHHYFDVAVEAPTLLQQEAPLTQQKELHELIGEVKESLNDRLKQQHTEVAHKLKETPIKDLRKAIGVNDKFAFVNELFRGDEAMYERSLKTINGFHILQEAEYWISRELKVKLGWNDNSETVRHFDQLVRRRFS